MNENEVKKNRAYSIKSNQSDIVCKKSMILYNDYKHLTLKSRSYSSLTNNKNNMIKKQNTTSQNTKIK